VVVLTYYGSQLVHQLAKASVPLHHQSTDLITALSIPSGYYVVSVNSYALSVAEYPTTLYLSLHIGDNIYGPYIGTVSGSDGESTSPSAWYRVADVRVNLSGTVDVITPDLTLNPWH